MIGKRKDIGKITGLIWEVTLMKDFSWKIFAIKKIIFRLKPYFSIHNDEIKFRQYKILFCTYEFLCSYVRKIFLYVRLEAVFQ